MVILGILVLLKGLENGGYKNVPVIGPKLETLSCISINLSTPLTVSVAALCCLF